MRYVHIIGAVNGKLFHILPCHWRQKERTISSVYLKMTPRRIVIMTSQIKTS